MSTANNVIIVSKKSMEDYAIILSEHYSIGYYLETAPGKEICEDALLVHVKDKNVMLAVCDGVGGSDRSYRAAKNVLTALGDFPLNSSIEKLEQELIEANAKLLALEGVPQTTLTCALIKDYTYNCLQIGDSGLIQCSNHGNLKYKSPMHSPVGKAIADGEIDETQALQREDLNIVDNVLGFKDCYVDTSSAQEISTYDTILLASDGIFDNFISSDLIALIFQGTMEEVCGNLTQIAKTKKYLDQKNLKKNDDISFICLKRL